MRRITVLAMVAVLALLVSACGDDDDSGGEEPEATDDGGTTDDGGDESGDEGGDAGVTDLGDLIDDDCEFLLAGSFLNPLAAATPGADVDFDETSEQLQAIADQAPDEIEDAMTVLAESFDEIAEVFADIDFSDPQSFQDPDTQAAIQELEEVAGEEYQEAADEVSAWMQENCTGVAGE